MTSAESKLVEIARELNIDTKKYKGNALCKQIRLAQKARAAEIAKDLLEMASVKKAKENAKQYVTDAKSVYEETKAVYEEALWRKRLAYEELQSAKAVRTAVNKQAPAYREQERAAKEAERAEKAKQRAEKAKAKEAKEQARKNALIAKLRAKLEAVIAASKVA